MSQHSLVGLTSKGSEGFASSLTCTAIHPGGLMQTRCHFATTVFVLVVESQPPIGMKTHCLCKHEHRRSAAPNHRSTKRTWYSPLMRTTLSDY